MIPDAEMKNALKERGVLAPARIKVKLRGGEEFCETVWEAKGGSENPMTLDEIRDKFRECAGYILSAQKVEKALENIEGLETLKNISNLTTILTS